MTLFCPCGSSLSYETCCGKFHLGEQAPTAEALMRSRYSAYVKGLASYIIATTHPSNTQYQKNQKKWKEEIVYFSRQTQFKQLDILHVKEGETEGVVTFHVTLFSLLGENRSFTEESFFQKEDGKWLYVKGIIGS